jgi:predicted amidophosphoribosyltransferase
MSFFEDMFEGFQRRGHGRNRDHGQHGHDDDYDHDRGQYYGPMGAPYAAPPAARVASMACPRCNAVVPLMPGTRFCAGCGGPLAVAPTCKSCGGGLTAGATFCPGCGTKV